MNTSKKILLVLASFLILPSIAFAEVTIPSIVDAAVQTTLYVASGVVVILWVVTGILCLSAQGAPEKLSSAKHSLIAAVAGTVIVIIATSAITIVRGAFKI